MKTAIVADSIFTKHLTGHGHPECPQRYESIIKALKEAKLLRADNLLKPRRATEEEIALCHLPQYYAAVRENMRVAKELGLVNGEYTLSTGDVQICPDTWEVAHQAVGAILTAVDAVMAGQAKNAFCVVRPPGHHATRDQGMGFCVFNNVAIGARYVQKKYGIKRVLIVDWDLHHGNGTQEIFEEDPTVFYLSTHQANIFPGTGFAEERGVGNLLNFPLIGNYHAREGVLKAFRIDLPEAMKAFKPEFVMISAGFDAHEDDPLGGFNLVEEDFAELTGFVKKIADEYAQGRIVSVLEGGYNLAAIGRSAVVHVKALEGT